MDDGKKERSREVLLLSARALIAEQEHITSKANHDLAKVGEWMCNYDEPFREIADDLQRVMEKLESAADQEEADGHAG